MNLQGLPAALLEGRQIVTDGSWTTRGAKQEPISVGYHDRYTLPEDNPEVFPFSYEKMEPTSAMERDGGLFYDFGTELFGYLNITGTDPNAKIHVSYGESREEALDIPEAILQEDLAGKTTYPLRQRAFRYIFLTGGRPEKGWAEREMITLDNTAEFLWDNEDVNRIGKMCTYTLHLNMREILTEAIKRDRWLWGGDAYQAFKFIKYYCLDQGTARAAA